MMMITDSGETIVIEIIMVCMMWGKWGNTFKKPARMWETHCRKPRIGVVEHLNHKQVVVLGPAHPFLAALA